MADEQMLDSGDEDLDLDRRRNNSRSRSRSPLNREEDGSDVDIDNLTPQSKKVIKIVEAVVAAQLAPVKRDLNKLMDSSSQIRGHTEESKRTLVDLRKSSASIEERVKKSTKEGPKSSLSGFAISKMYDIVYHNLKMGKKKVEVQLAAVQDLIDRGAVTVENEDDLKTAAGSEFANLKGHLRQLISQDLSSGNGVKFPKAEQYLKSHLKLQTVEDADHQYLTIMALGVAKFENSMPVVLGDADKENKKKIEKDFDNYWSWVSMKFAKYQKDGTTQGNKLKNIVDHIGYKATKRGTRF